MGAEEQAYLETVRDPEAIVDYPHYFGLSRTQAVGMGASELNIAVREAYGNANLTVQQMQVLDLRTGFVGRKSKSLDEVAKELNIDKQTVKDIESDATGRLKLASGSA